MYEYFLSLGSNIESEYAHISQAVEKLKLLKKTKLKLSNFYITEAQNLTEQRSFLNVCVHMDSEINPMQFLDELKSIEKKLGRTKGVRYGPRVIDIDIIWVRGIKIKTSKLEIPHPRAFERNFVLTPLSELAVGDNELMRLIKEHKSSVEGQSVKRISEYQLKSL